MNDQYENLGHGLLTPFRRDGKGDFAHDKGLELVKSSVRTILGTMCAGPNNAGEVPYNQKLGTLLKTLRHRNFSQKTHDLAVYYVAEGLRINEPRVRLTSVEVDQRVKDRKFIVRLTYNVVSGDVPGVIAKDVQQEEII